MSARDFEFFKAELVALREVLSSIKTKTLRDEDLRERFRNLFRTWFGVVRPRLDPLLKSKRELLKLNADLEALASLTTKIKPVLEYKKRTRRAISLANALVLHLPPTKPLQVVELSPARDDLFVKGIPDLPIRLVPNALLGWRPKIEAFINKYKFDRSVFVMIRYRKRNKGLIHVIKSSLGKHGFKAIIASEHKLTDDLYNPVACLLCCSRGLAIFDKAESGQVFNPNVAYEIGMMHLLGRDCQILKHGSLKVLHTDILMKLYLEYTSIKEAQNHLDEWLSDEQ